MFHIFKITNLINNKIFIGYYYGEKANLYKKRISNKDLSKDIKKYGKENFVREILYSYDNIKETKLKYKELTPIEFYNSNVYNLNIYNKILVKDSSENILKLSRNDPKLILGNYVNVTTKPHKPNKHKSPLHSLSVSKYQFEKRKKIFKEFPFEIKTINKYFLIEKFCKHGDLIIHRHEFKNIYKNGNNLHEYCTDCLKEWLQSIYLSKSQIEENRILIKKLYLQPSRLKENYILRNHPLLYKCIVDNINKDISWIEKTYLFKESLNDMAKCNYINCDHYTNFSKSNKRYSYFCDIHSHGHFSKGEMQLFDYVNSKVECKKHHINKKELDVFVPSLNIAFEFNGIYTHCDLNKDKNYHYDKWKLCKDNNIQLITIWEDDWNYKCDIVKSIINNKLKIIQNKIYARKCIIKEVNYNDTKIFLNNNHIQGHCISKINLGLYYNNELVSLMTFGNRSIGRGSHFELLRFCSKLNTSVIGAASKLFKHFLNNYNFKGTIITYANCNISDGNLYEVLGFKYECHTKLNYWWADHDKRYNRLKFMNHKIKDKEDEYMRNKGFYKIYGIGNLMYKYIN